jgi:hypothetical protein
LKIHVKDASSDWKSSLITTVSGVRAAKDAVIVEKVTTAASQLVQWNEVISGDISSSLIYSFPRSSKMRPRRSCSDLPVSFPAVFVPSAGRLVTAPEESIGRGH